MKRRATRRERELASHVLAAEGGQDQDPERCLESLARAFDRLYRGMGAVVGPAGYLALTERALHLVAAERPNLRSVHPSLEGERFRFDGIGPSTAGQGSAEVHDVAVAVLGNFLWLTISFIGPDLTRWLIQAAWPTIDRGAWDTYSKNENAKG